MKIVRVLSQSNLTLQRLISVLFLIYVPMAMIPYFTYGANASPNVVLNLSRGHVRTTVEIMLLLHLVTAFPIILNPPNQYFEHVLNIPSQFGVKRCGYRTLAMAILLSVSQSIPSFGSILDLVGATSVTMLTFVCPPYFYMRLCDSSSQNPQWTQRKIPKWERIYCWFLILISLLGGAAATYISIKGIVQTDFQMPCYLQANAYQISTTTQQQLQRFEKSSRGTGFFPFLPTNVTLRNTNVPEFWHYFI